MQTVRDAEREEDDVSEWQKMEAERRQRKELIQSWRWAVKPAWITAAIENMWH